MLGNLLKYFPVDEQVSGCRNSLDRVAQADDLPRQKELDMIQLPGSNYRLGLSHSANWMVGGKK